jgi:methylmalonyl-CoA mutase C-terminal domain/subunit
MTLAPLVVEAVRARGADIPVILGGTVPDHDLDELKALGVAAVLTPGTTADDIIKEVQQVLDGTQVA